VSLIDTKGMICWSWASGFGPVTCSLCSGTSGFGPESFGLCSGISGLGLGSFCLCSGISGGSSCMGSRSLVWDGMSFFGGGN
jgi:hypothetical protein